MNWICIIWSAAAGACLIMALMHVLMWCRNRQAWANLCFVVMVLGVLGLTLVDMVMLTNDSLGVYRLAMEWLHPLYALGVAGSLGFIHFYFGTGKRWLLALALGLRGCVLVANFTTGLNLHISSIESLHSMKFLGETVSILGEWVPNRWALLGQLAAIAQIIYLADASLRLWRTGTRELRRRAVLIGGALMLFFVLAPIYAGLLVTGVLRLPLIFSLPFVATLLAMSYELSGEMLRAVSLAKDLRERDLGLALAAEAANLGFWSRDLTSNQINASERWRALFGFTPTEPLDFNAFTNRVHPGDREKLREVQAKAIAEDGVYDFEYRVVHLDGRVRWITSRGRFEFGPNAKPVFLRGVSADITDRKLAEEKFRLVVEASPNGIVLANDQGQIVLVNAATEKLFGYARQELIGQAVEQLLPEVLRAEHPGGRAIFQAALHARRIGVDQELSAQRKDGSIFPVEISLSPIESAEGVLVVAVIVDITSRRQIEAEAARQRNELTHIARVSMLGQLASSLAHELSQPLGAILRNAEAGELFLRHPSPDLEELRAILEDIRKDDQRAGAVISRMRAFLQRHEIERCPIDLNTLVTEVIGLVRTDADARKVKLDFEPVAGLPSAQGDHIQLQQVLLNLLLNAMDAMHDSTQAERRVAVRIAPAGRMLEVMVCDTGPGIPAEKFSSLFEPFFTTKQKGLGMGLSISRTIIEAHGGRLRAENNPAGGATFCFSLPVSERVEGE